MAFPFSADSFRRRAILPRYEPWPASMWGTRLISGGRFNLRRRCCGRWVPVRGARGRGLVIVRPRASPPRRFRACQLTAACGIVPAVATPVLLVIVALQRPALLGE